MRTVSSFCLDTFKKFSAFLQTQDEHFMSFFMEYASSISNSTHIILVTKELESDLKE